MESGTGTLRRWSIAAAAALLALASAIAIPAHEAADGPSVPAQATLEERQEAAAAASQWWAAAQAMARFEPDRGQLPDGIAYAARFPGFHLGIGTDRLVLADGTSSAVLRFAGAAGGEPVGSEPLPGVASYFKGDDPSSWASAVPGFARVTVPGLYPGIDLVVYSDEQGRPEFDLVVAPGADASAVRMVADGASLAADAGALRVEGTPFTLAAPRLFQDGPSGRVPVAGAFALGAGEATFQVGAHDAALPLVIDPVISYASFAGGTQNDVAVETFVRGSSVWVLGQTKSGSFPSFTPSPVVPALQYTADWDAFVARFDTGVGGAAGLKWVAYIGSNSVDTADGGIGVDDAGNVYGAISCFDTCPSVGPSFDLDKSSSAFDAYVFSLRPDGTQIRWSAYIGGEYEERAFALTIASGSVWVAGSSERRPTLGDAFREQNQMYPGFGGTGYADSDTIDAFLSRITLDGMTYQYGSLFGGKVSGASSATNKGRDEAYGIAVDGDVAYVVGTTQGIFTSATHPAMATTTTNAAQGIYQGHKSTRAGSDYDGFLIKIDTSKAGAAQHLYGTYIGGSGAQAAYGVELDPTDPGSVIVLSQTDSGAGGCPTTTGSGGTTAGIKTSAGGPPSSGTADLCLTRYDTEQAGTAGLRYGSYFGGTPTERIHPGPPAKTAPAADCPQPATIGCPVPDPLDVDHLGRAYFTARASSGAESPFVANPAFAIVGEETHSGGGGDDALVAIVDPHVAGTSGVRMVSYVGAPGVADRPMSLDFENGQIVLVGETAATTVGPGGFPITAATPTTTEAAQSTNQGQLDAFVVRIKEMIPLQAPTFTWTANPSDQYHLGWVHPETQVILRDTTPAAGYEEGQSIVEWSWDLDALGKQTGTDPDAMRSVVAQFPARPAPYVVRLTTTDNYGTSKTSVLPAVLDKPHIVRSFENICPVVTTSPIPDGISAGDQITLVARAEKLDNNFDGLPDGVIPSYNVRSFTDGVLSGTTLQSAAADFTVGDEGAPVVGSGIPAGTVVAAYVSQDTVTLSNAATSGTAVSVLIGTQPGWLFGFGDGESARRVGVQLLDLTFRADAPHLYNLDGSVQPVVHVTDDDGCTTVAPFEGMKVAQTFNTEEGPSFFGRRPTADAGPDQIATEGDVVRLEAFGTCGVYRWARVEGPIIILNDDGTAKPWFVAPDVEDAEDVVLHFVCNDGRLDSLPDEVRVTVLATDKSPRADAGIDGAGREGVLYTLDGTGSIDPEGRKLSYRWTQVSGPGVVLSNDEAAQPSFTMPPFVKDAQLVFRLVVHDGTHASLPDQVIVDIQPVQELDFTYHKENVAAGTLVRFVPMDSTLGRNHDWDFGDGATSQEKAPTHIYEEAGRYTVTLTVTQPDGHQQSYQKRVDAYGGIGDTEAQRTAARAEPKQGEFAAFVSSPGFIALAALVLGAPIAVLLAVRFAKK